MTSVWCTQFILPLHQEESCGFQKKSVSEPFLPVDWLKINTHPWSRLKTYIKNVMAKAWADGLLLQEPQILQALVRTPRRQSGASYMSHKQRYMMYLIEWAMKDLASEKQNQHVSSRTNGCCHLLSPFPPSAPSPWKDMKTVSCGITCWG